MACIALAGLDLQNTFNIWNQNLFQYLVVGQEDQEPL